MITVRALALSAVLATGSPGIVSSEIIRTYAGLDDPALAVAETAIGLWEALLPEGFAFTLAVERASLGGTLAFSSDFVEAGGRPVSATITIDDGSSGIPWFVDDTPGDDREYRTGQNRFHAMALGPGPSSGFDLLTVMQHELAHAFGFSIFYSAFADHVEHAPDGNRTYRGSAVFARLTGAGAGTHILPEAHGVDLMNPELGPGTRLRPSPLDLAILRDAYGYALSDARPLQPTDVAEPAALILLAFGGALARVSRARRLHDRRAAPISDSRRRRVPR